MKIINIVPGFGGTFYCGNCLRDSGFITSLRKAGHDAVTLPIYLPLFAEADKNQDDVPVFYGAVNIYLKQNFKVFRRMPRWLYRFFNSAPVLRYAAKKAGSTRATGLEDMTISMLKGHEGYQKEELQQLVDYLGKHEKPDVVHLSNALLIGLAHKIKNELGIPVVCSLQDEDVWIDPMEETARKKVWQILSEKAKDVDAFIAVSQYFADLMKEKMNIPDEKLHAIHVGVDPDKYTAVTPNLETPVIGYLSRLNKECGFEMLIDGFIHLKNTTRHKNARLVATGGKSPDDNKFIKAQLKKLKAHGYEKDIEFVEDFSAEDLKDFFPKTTVLSVPVLKGEAFGLFLLESLASGIPIVQPSLGAFPEIVSKTKGGAIYEPDTPEALAQKLDEVLSDQNKLIEMSKGGRKAVETLLHLDILTMNMVSVYEKITGK